MTSKVTRDGTWLLTVLFKVRSIGIIVCSVELIRHGMEDFVLFI
jgi:hypothetical protein